MGTTTEAARLRAENDRLRASYGWLDERFPVIRTEVKRLQDGIRDLWETWMDDDATWVEVAGKLDDLHTSLDRIGADECTHESVDTFGSGAGRRVDVCMACEVVMRFWNETEEVACTGITATYCPMHGDCTCDPGDDGTPSLDDSGCPLHDPLSDHAA